jgi:hypothetical protein
MIGLRPILVTPFNLNHCFKGLVSKVQSSSSTPEAGVSTQGDTTQPVEQSFGCKGPMPSQAVTPNMEDEPELLESQVTDDTARTRALKHTAQRWV